MRALEDKPKTQMADLRQRRFDLIKANTTLETEQLSIKRQIAFKDITAPFSGFVHEIKPIAHYEAISQGSELMRIVPNSAELIAEVRLLNKDIGFIEPGQEVIVKIDALPFLKYGYINGQLMTVSYDVLGTDEERVFRGYVKLEKQKIDAIEGLRELRAGMSVIAEVKLDDRRVIDYFLSTFKQYQKESMREK